MTTMLEKAARAAGEYIDRCVDGEFPGDAFTNGLARAVLMAVREPGQSVVDRGTAQINYDCPAPADAPPDDDYSDTLRRSFTAMIDAILSPSDMSAMPKKRAPLLAREYEAFCGATPEDTERTARGMALMMLSHATDLLCQVDMGEIRRMHQDAMIDHILSEGGDGAPIRTRT